ncbi:hypothetical protein BECAL_02637 [Bellilinea caldifistulae]|nr:hypothetical protein BECAL_02637 [Bellilinea caldifistulae]
MRSRLMTALTVAIGLMILLISLLFAAVQSGLLG